MTLTIDVQRLKPIAVVLFVALICGSTAMAGTISACAAGSGGPTPGNTIFPVDCTGSTSGTLLAFMSQSFSYHTTAGTNSGFVYSAVYNDGGTLDFYYQVVNSSTSATALARMTANTFTGFTTNSAFIANGHTLGGTSFVDGTVMPVTSDSTGAVIGFSFYPVITDEIQPGQESNVLIISTNAKSYSNGNAAIIDGGSTFVNAFQPTGVPEPATLGLLGLGLIGVASLRRRIRS